MEVALVLTLILLVFLFRAPIYPETEFVIEETQQETVRVEEIPQTQQQLPPPPPRPLPPVAVPDETILEEEAVEFESELQLDQPLNIPPPPPPPEEENKEEETEPEIFITVEEMPEIIGGQEAIYKNLEYPEMARKAGMEGLVVVGFVVEPDGSVSNVHIIKSAGKILDDAAIKAVKKLHFKPGKQRGKPVRVRMALPVRFKLQ